MDNPTPSLTDNELRTIADAAPDLTKLHRSELEAMVVDMAKTAERYRVSIGMIALGIEDEGDRAYFGSTNDAEELRDIEQELAEPGNYIACPWMHGTDLYADLRELRTERIALLDRLAAHEAERAADKARIAELEDALTEIRDYPYGTAEAASDMRSIAVDAVPRTALERTGA